MKVVVTGATGNIGGAVAKALAADERVSEVVGLARRPPVEQGQAGIRYVAADVGEDDLTPHLEGADAVVHTAWLFQPMHDPMTTWQANAIGSVRLFDAAAAAGVRVVLHTSSVGAYSPAHGRYVDESWPTHSVPTAAYGREKAYAERALDALEAANPEMRVIRVRPCFVFQRSSASAQRRLMAGPFVPTSLLRPGRLPVVPWPRGLRIQAMHTDDLAEAFRLLTVSDETRGAYNVAADPVVDAELVGRVLGSRVVPVPSGAAKAVLQVLWRLHLVPAEPALVDMVTGLPLMETERIRALGWSPRVSAGEALAEVLVGMADHAGAQTPSQAPDSLSIRKDELATGVGERSTPED